jgi:hypothetical protein
MGPWEGSHAEANCSWPCALPPAGRARVFALPAAASSRSNVVTPPMPGADPTLTIDPTPGLSPQGPSPSSVPTFVGSVTRIDRTLRERLVGRNWHPGCPVTIHDLRLVEVTYRDFRGDVRMGPLVVHQDVAADVLWVPATSRRRSTAAPQRATWARCPTIPTDGRSTSTRCRTGTFDPTARSSAAP